MYIISSERCGRFKGKNFCNETWIIRHVMNDSHNKFEILNKHSFRSVQTTCMTSPQKDQ